MSPKVVNVHCKKCGKDFNRIDWLTNKECDMPEACSCPEVKKAMQQANQAINKARTKAFSVEKRVTSLHTRLDENTDQIYLTGVEPLVVIEVKRIYQQGKRK
jgi:predicted HAD superfamily Cof-like phosphohydrolase